MGREESDRNGVGQFQPGSGQKGPGIPVPTINRAKIIVGPVISGGKIGAQSGSITKINLFTPEGTLLLWQNGAAVSPAPTVAVGAAWELHTYFTVTSSVGNWAVFVTIVNTNGNMPSAYQRLSVGNRYISSGTVSDNLNRNMSVMPASDVALRIKLWVTDYYTTTPPPDSGETAW
ncbi:MAG: hypothetical protein PHG61_03360 [Candidatus Marinimicrobia bacterium]|jgi:hypothetical protein|nr:hypothetical protein [Candidatus Neomarinimicrobiota bacterium]